MLNNKRLNLFFPSIILAGGISSAYAAIIQDNTITPIELNDFEGQPTAIVDSDLVLPGASYSEKFDGQLLSLNGDFDTLSGQPTDPLTLVAGSVGQNLYTSSYEGSMTLAGCGSLNCPNFEGIGEGAVSVLLDYDTDEIGFDVVGSHSGTGTVQIFGRNGDTLATFIVNLADSFFGFKTTAGERIAGISLTNFNGGGIGFDNFKFNQLPNIPQLTCVDGFLPPLDQVVSVKKKSKKVIPVKCQLVDESGALITADDIATPPVINITFNGTVFGTVPADDVDLLPTGAANDDNVMRYDWDENIWIYNLGTAQFPTPGTYSIDVVPGDQSEYDLLDSSQDFVRQN